MRCDESGLLSVLRPNSLLEEPFRNVYGGKDLGSSKLIKDCLLPREWIGIRNHFLIDLS